MSRETWIPSMAGIAAGAYALHGMVTDTGPAGWIDYVQQSIFGWYSMKITMLVLMMGVFGVVALAWAVASIGRTPGAPPPLARPVPRTADAPAGFTWKTLATVFAGFTVVTWAIGLGALWWNHRIDREDSTATYVPAVPSAGGSLPEISGTHVSLGGRLLRERTVEFSRGKSSTRTARYHLVPVTAPGWREGDPVRYVIKVDRIESLALAPPAHISLASARAMRTGPAAQPEAERWLGRLEGQVPVPAAQEFKKMGVPLADRAQLVRWIPSVDGRPDIPDTWARNLEITTWICLALTALYVLIFPLMGWSSNRAQRKARSG
ncbi:MAG TPA: hypothetical protein PK359_03900 [Burkholderiaceae bacterium]|nr:hypothetical protein [Burkholderiaceae bacterium]